MICSPLVCEVNLFFTLLPRGSGVPRDASAGAFLIDDRWDDWGKFRTQFQLVVVDAAGKQNEIGDVKIGRRGLRSAREIAPGMRAPELPPQFEGLGDEFFSVGQGEAYYEALNNLDEGIRHRVLSGLRDCAYDLSIFDLNLDEEVMTTSLLRYVAESSVRGKLRRLALGDATLTEYDFSYLFPDAQEIDEQVRLDFKVERESVPPSNVHVLIGRNGVGKTHCMRMLALTLLGRPAPDGGSPGRIVKRTHPGESAWEFAGVVLVSFSAFDGFELNPHEQDTIGFRQIGLREPKSNEKSDKIFERLAKDFAHTLQRCREGLRARRWTSAIDILDSDDLFAAADVKSLLAMAFDEKWTSTAIDLFKRLSSGHAIVLLTITRLVEAVDEKTLVLLDEPEGHLHPPLISAFIQCLSQLLTSRNGVAIIATHSPVVLQEVSRQAAWKLRRTGPRIVAERPTVETFGENLGVLTREVFGFQVTRSGFHGLISAAVNRGLSFEQLLAEFDGQLGAEAQAIARGLIAQRLRAAGAPK